MFSKISVSMSLIRMSSNPDYNLSMELQDNPPRKSTPFQMHIQIELFGYHVDFCICSILDCCVFFRFRAYDSLLIMEQDGWTLDIYGVFCWCRIHRPS